MISIFLYFNYYTNSSRFPLKTTIEKYKVTTEIIITNEKLSGFVDSTSNDIVDFGREKVQKCGALNPNYFRIAKCAGYLNIVIFLDMTKFSNLHHWRLNYLLDFWI